MNTSSLCWPIMGAGPHRRPFVADSENDTGERARAGDRVGHPWKKSRVVEMSVPRGRAEFMSG